MKTNITKKQVKELLIDYLVRKMEPFHEKYCTFCGKSSDEVDYLLITGKDKTFVSICDECVEICAYAMGKKLVDD